MRIPLLVLLGAAAMAHLGSGQGQQPPSSPIAGSPEPSPLAAGDRSKPIQSVDEPPPGIKLSDVEFGRFKVSLPAPVDGPWEGPFYDHKSCFDRDKKGAAVEVLPFWIRKAVLAGKSDIAARYLWSLLRLSEDADPEIEIEATFAIYRLGDHAGVAAARMQRWMESETMKLHIDSLLFGSDVKDVRAVVLAELELNNDRSLDQAIHDVWQRRQAHEGADVAAVDYAYYLEKHGRTLPMEYWERRLENRSGFENALAVLEKRGGAGKARRPGDDGENRTGFRDTENAPARTGERCHRCVGSFPADRGCEVSGLSGGPGAPPVDLAFG
jgi:hypothetical protein